jgi:hypothetical protein
MADINFPSILIAQIVTDIFESNPKYLKLCPHHPQRRQCDAHTVSE